MTAVPDRRREDSRPRRIVAASGEYFNTLLDHSTASLLIVGGPGSGKTSFCRWRALKDARRLQAGESARVPILVPLHAAKPKPDQSFRQAFLIDVSESVLVGRSEKIDRDTPLRVFLDGLDEVESVSARTQVLKAAQRAGDDFTDCQVVITSRDHIWGPELLWLPRVELGGLSSDQLLVLARKWLGEESGRFIDELQKVSGLQSLATVPLLATLMIWVFRHTGRIPKSRCQLYRMFTDLLAGGWNLAKGIYRPTSFSSDQKLQVLADVAWHAHKNRRRLISRRRLGAAIRSVSGARMAALGGFEQELIGDGIIEATSKGFAFRHLTFQEYFAAKYAASSPLGRELKVLISELTGGSGDFEWWREVVRFYIEILGRPHAAMEWLTSMMQATEDYARAEEMRTWLMDTFPECDWTAGGEDE